MAYTTEMVYPDYDDQLSEEFILAIKQKTGFDGYELQDYIDLLVADVFMGWDFAGYIQMNLDLVIAAKRRLSRFRTYLAIAMICLMALPMIIVAVQAATVATTTALAQGMTTLGALKLGVGAFASSIALTFKAFMTAIHFDTLVGVHKVAYLVSEDYRNVMRSVYGEITKVSDALGFGPYFLTLALQNTRNLVLDVSTSLGMRYDMAEVSWLGTFQGYMKNFAGAAYKYKNDPESFFFDLSRWVEKDALSTKGAFIEGLVKTVQNTTEAVAGAVEQVVVIRDDLRKLVLDLPEAIRSQVEPTIMPYIEKFDDFITDTYDPYKKELDTLIGQVRSLQGSQRLQMVSLVDRLKKPATYLFEIDKLEDWEKLEQEEMLDDISSRHYQRKLADFSAAVEPLSAELKKVSTALLRPPELIPWESGEAEAPVPLPIGEIDETRTWFIGDY